MAKKNCWEVLKCGRGPRGVKEHELGLCPAATETKVNGLHGGINGGRVCWAITGTLCTGKVQGEYAEKIKECTSCEFYKQTHKEEGVNFLFVKKIFEKLK